MMTDFPVGGIKVRSRFRKDLGCIDDLVESIRNNGLIQPIVVDRDGDLVAGERRLVAVQRLGWKTIPTVIVDLDDYERLRVEEDENTIRKDFTPSEAVAIRNARLARERERAKERQEATQFGSDGSGNFPEPDKGDSRDKAAEGTGYSGRTLDKAAAVMEAAAADPALEPVVEEMDRTGKVDPAYRKVRGDEKTATGVSKSRAAVAARRERIGELAAQGHTPQEIAELVGMSVSGVHRIAKAAGIKLPNGRQHEPVQSVDQQTKERWDKLFPAFDALGFVLSETDFSGFEMTSADRVAYRRFRKGLSRFHRQMGSPQ